MIFHGFDFVLIRLQVDKSSWQEKCNVLRWRIHIFARCFRHQGTHLFTTMINVWFNGLSSHIWPLITERNHCNWVELNYAKERKIKITLLPNNTCAHDMCVVIHLVSPRHNGINSLRLCVARAVCIAEITDVVGNHYSFVPVSHVNCSLKL